MLKLVFSLTVLVLTTSCVTHELKQVDTSGYPNIPLIDATQQQLDARAMAVLMDIRPADGVIQGVLLQAMWSAYEAVKKTALEKEEFGDLRENLITYNVTEDKLFIWFEWRSFPLQQLTPEYFTNGGKCAPEWPCYASGGSTAYQVTLDRKSMDTLEVLPIDS